MLPESSTPVPDTKPNRIWAFVIVFLLVVTGVSTVIALVRYQPAEAIEIRLSEEQEFKGNILVSGAVANPGIYPYSSSDTISGLMQSAGGVTANADKSTLILNVPQAGAQTTPQKININRAEAWLLEALPGIGSTRAKTIIAYREKYGLFRNTSELMKVEGIGQALYDQIKDLITVSD